jgi:LmbE family N-acetylglucosaminyl deacetylase
MSRVLLMVPHEDDELLVGGPMLVNLNHSGYEVYVYIATNGDYYPFESATRAHESLKALKLLGVDRSRVFFGGYGDGWQGTCLYDSGYHEERISAAGFKETHGPARGIEEWHFIMTGEHAPYTKSAYREDIKELIDRLRPEIIITVGFDSHSDHRALYQMTLEALAILYAKDSSYSPEFLEKFAYEGNLFGKRDFFCYPHLPSAPPSEDFAPVFDDWERRICYRVPGNCNTFFLMTNFLFKVLRSYRTQGIWQEADRIINSDTVYWQRNAVNKLLLAEISSSSGEVCWLNDNKLFEPVSADEIYCDLTTLCFRPEADDNEKTVRVKLKAPSDLKLLLLYFNTPGGISTDIIATFFYKEGSEQIIHKFYESKDDFSILRIELDRRTCREFSLSFRKVQGNLGLGEIEALEEEPRPPLEEFLAESQTSEQSRFLTKVLQPERLLFGAMKRIRRIKNLRDYKRDRFDRNR